MTIEDWWDELPRDDVRCEPLLPLRLQECQTLRALLRRWQDHSLEETVDALRHGLNEGYLDPYDREVFYTMTKNRLKRLADQNCPLPLTPVQVFKRLRPQARRPRGLTA